MEAIKNYDITLDDEEITDILVGIRMFRLELENLLDCYDDISNDETTELENKIEDLEDLDNFLVNLIS